MESRYNPIKVFVEASSSWPSGVEGISYCLETGYVKWTVAIGDIGLTPGTIVSVVRAECFDNGVKGACDR